MWDAEAAPPPGRSVKAARAVLGGLAFILLGLLAWRLLAGTPRLTVGGWTVVSMRDVSRPLIALGAVLILRHLLRGPGSPLDRIAADIAVRMTAPLRGIAGGVALWGILGLISGATRALTLLVTTRHLEVTLHDQALWLGAHAARDALWGLVCGIPGAALVALLVWLRGMIVERGAGSQTRGALLNLDLFLMAGAVGIARGAGVWGRAERWDLAPAPFILPPRLLAAVIALALAAVVALLVSGFSRGGRSRRTAWAWLAGAILAGAGAYFLTPLPSLLFGGPPPIWSARGAPSTSRAAPAPREGEERPAGRILLVTVDTLRADHLGCYGYTRPTSPRMDRLAAFGTRFERAYCAIPLTDPSHASILTGWYPRAHGCLRNGSAVVAGSGVPSLPGFLSERGYATAAITSRRHLHPRELGIEGFGFYSVPVSEERVGASDTLERALEWLAVHGREKYFLWVHFFDPHFPYEPPEEFGRRFVPAYHGALNRGNNYVGERYSNEDVGYLTGLYDGEIATADEAVGRLAEAVLSDPVDSNPPLIIVTSDHGESLGELKERFDYVFAHGEYLVEAQVRVPLIIVRSGMVPAGKSIGEVVEILSIAPTIAAAAGDSFRCQAGSLWPLIAAQGSGAAEQSEEAAAAFVQRRYYEDPPKPYHRAEECAITTHAWKLVHNTMRGPELYDLSSDPGEERNESARRLEVAEALGKRLEEWKASHPIPKEAFGEVDSDTLEQLRSLGYVR